ncbi:hypothetical protein ACO0R3_003222 [Hanseniaspora guilliermondii]
MSLQKKLLTEAKLKLHNTKTEVFIPQYGFGTASAPDQLEETKTALKAAVKAGVRNIDTARYYGNGHIEYAIGEAIQELIKEGVVTREDLFITTKVWPNYWNRAADSLETSLKALQVDYVDLLLQHWPLCFPQVVNEKTGELIGKPHDENGEPIYEKDGDYIVTFQQINKILDDPANGKKVRAIGVSNYDVLKLERVFADESIKNKPSVLQVELNPQLNQTELIDFCTKKGITVIGYSPLGSSGAPILKLPELKEIGDKHGIKPYDVVISWFISKNLVVIPRTINPDRFKDIKYYYELPEEDIKKIDQIGETKPYRHIDEDFAHVLPGFTGRTKTENE